MRKKAKISMVARESADEAFSRLLLTKRAGGVKTKTIDTYSQHFHAISKHLDIHQEITEWTSADLQPHKLVAVCRRRHPHRLPYGSGRERKHKAVGVGCKV